MPELLSQAEENYLKAIFKICESEGKAASTNAIASELSTSAAAGIGLLSMRAVRHRTKPRCRCSVF